MAGSRLPHFGTIFTRMTGLLETGVTKDVPVWYNVYKKYPPNPEPKVDRPIPPQDPILEIVYEEDFDRVQRSSREFGPKRQSAYSKKSSQVK